MTTVTEKSVEGGSVERAVRERYAEGALRTASNLCCPVDYDPRYLGVIPQEVLERDYGCGDPSQWLSEGETVLDLGSGTGKVCFIASQVVGRRGRVIGVDMTPAMLEVARRNAPTVAERIGYANVEFRRGRIQDLKLDLDLLDQALSDMELTGADALLEAEHRADALRSSKPLVPDGAVDVVMSNCVLNLVEHDQKEALFGEIYRVIRRGGRAVISDIVSDEPVPEHMRQDPELWSGCVSGALTEVAFLTAFERAGFHGIHIVARPDEPWRTVEGIEFRSITVEAFKGTEGACWERNQAVIYKGPFKEVLDDDGHRMRRGRRYAVCDKTYQIYKGEPYRDSFAFVEPKEQIPLEDAVPFDCKGTRIRHPKESKGEDYDLTTQGDGEACGPEGCC